ncbi:hypothetical protein C2869_09125 [Saccharobesus litoralis]|uniref:Ion channel protein Tsx n=1 Tax=Saccharobesus litoralis TaxID=2172099 RepID=A0A2S0VQX3_9ALTE|nr:TorF family putative porin [Saccharobesus litoralis]AWB66582.1 hypothetical protein C2869_09125 [Saccharobesus litoralis]
MTNHINKILLATALTSCSVQATTSGYITLGNDYLFKGQSLTNEKAALSGAIDLTHDSGWYMGAWASNVDFAGANSELDLYTGYGWQVNDELALNAGVVSYSYFGDITPNNSLNYAEIYLQATVNDNWQFGYWFAPDYAGVGQKHSILLLSYSHAINEKAQLIATTNLLYNHDTNAYQNANKAFYNHASLGVSYSFDWLELQVALESHNDHLDGDWQKVTPYLALTYAF